jgi:hypothetical protein
LLLSGIQVLQSMSIWVRTRRHAAHEGRVYLSSRSGHCHGTAELMRHTASRSALLARVMRHAGGHGMPGDAWVSHAGGMPRKVWTHTGCHHVYISWPTIHQVDIDERV